MSAIRVFACFDPAHDADLHELLTRQCAAPGSMLALVDWSRAEPRSGWEDKLRRRLSDVDAAVVICGEHTSDDAQMNRELCILQEEDKPYVLLWGRRSSDCSKPLVAKATDRFYTWIGEILTGQLEIALRKHSGDVKESDLGGLRGRARPR